MRGWNGVCSVCEGKRNMRWRRTLKRDQGGRPDELEGGECDWLPWGTHVDGSAGTLDHGRSHYRSNHQPGKQDGDRENG